MVNYNIMEDIAGEWYKDTFTDHRKTHGFSWDELIDFGVYIYDRVKGGTQKDGL